MSVIDFSKPGSFGVHANDDTKRWKAVLSYTSPSGSSVQTVTFEEIAELHDIIERGPDWNELDQCVITLAARPRGEQ